MTREEKYPETDTFIYHNQNPKHRITEDCEYRAASLALDIPYNDAVMQLAEIACKTGYAPCGNRGEDKLFEKHGWVKHKQPRHEDNTKLTGEEFARMLTRRYPNGEAGNIFAHIGGHHVVCIKPIKEDTHWVYKIHDTWNSTSGCIGNWFARRYCKI